MNGGETSARIASSDKKRLPRMTNHEMQKAMTAPSTSAPTSPPKLTTNVLRKARRNRTSPKNLS